MNLCYAGTKPSKPQLCFVSMQSPRTSSAMQILWAMKSCTGWALAGTHRAQSGLALAQKTEFPHFSRTRHITYRLVKQQAHALGRCQGIQKVLFIFINEKRPSGLTWSTKHAMHTKE